MNSLTYDEIDRLFEVDFFTGKLVWKVSTTRKNMIGKEAGTKRVHAGKGYIEVGIHGRRYMRSKIVFCAFHKQWSTKLIDHKDGDSTNDSISNLREATQQQNCFNRILPKSKSNLPRGVRQSSTNRFQAVIMKDRKAIYLGSFKELEKASLAYESKRVELFGEFA